MNIFKQHDLESSAITFNNEHEPESEYFEIELNFGALSTWDNPYKLFVNGELKATYKTLASIEKNAARLINNYNLMAVK